MPLDLPAAAAASYLVSPGATTPETTRESGEFHRLLALVGAATDARIDLVQLREKLLRPRVLYELAARCAEVTRGTGTRLLVNDRADIARAAGADGVHLAARSLDASVVRRAFGPDFLIGVSAHALAEARAARAGGADFAVFGPVFDTPSKRALGSPLGVEALREVAHKLSPFPVFAIGGVTRGNAPQVIRAGARGVAAIRLFSDADSLREAVEEIGSVPFTALE
ncbi:MAG: thiamine phosphate synthase [Acidobacteria bacterium]|nr:thiamine phosphate synthase [Acidobacteriota bacterium]MCA1632421.1 thiamine phosphate synthase [Acidobacteriota bacterium]MCA1640763.1 thiamine phosphate synthase [Acidobacteriota bacterium]